MSRNQQSRNNMENALRQLGVARGNLLLMIIFTAINILLCVVGTDTMLLFSATVPYFIAVFGMLSEATKIIFLCIGVSAAILLLYLLCWIFSKKHYGWMVAALVLFLIDSAAMVALYIWIEDFSGILDVLIHAWVLYYLVVGVIYGYKLKHISPEDELAYEQLRSDAENSEMDAFNDTPLRMADTDVKFRVLVEGEYAGYNICFRRVKRVNELVINGYVYDDIEMLIENAHQLNAAVGGHHISAGCKGTHSYIIVDGQQIAKKIRLV